MDGEPAEKFHLAWALGKTKEKMEKDFYIFQIKELMKKMGNALISPVGDLVSIEKLVTRLIKFETHDLLTSPLVAMELANKKSNLFKNLSLTAIVGYPCGENGFKSINTEVKVLVKKGVKNIIVFYAFLFYVHYLYLSGFYKFMFSAVNKPFDVAFVLYYCNCCHYNSRDKKWNITPEKDKNKQGVTD